MEDMNNVKVNIIYTAKVGGLYVKDVWNTLGKVNLSTHEGHGVALNENQIAWLKENIKESLEIKTTKVTTIIEEEIS